MSTSAVRSIGTKGVPRAEREQQIVAAAVVEFAAAGYAAGSLTRVATAAGISKPLVYQYFGSKDGLYLACLHDVVGGLLARLADAELDVDDTVASRIHPLRAIFAALEPRREAWRLLFDPSAPTTGPISEVTAQYRAQTAELAASGSASFLRARGTYTELDASALTAVWMGLVDSLVSWWLEHPDEPAESMVARCERLLTAVLT
ncbi:TetR/AcrR family transcriptional regulator [Jatrophihabitans endophyticus]|uniref:TetR/AcrR family transcriptional regulator n=1 Tax=Jatrophihabitans endophyticus TaxID=1206085 RepID=UPI0019E8F909|nr:TetR/AcrR family transcriptional regulator [Jatrophihabitans endophyticus]MBE7188042.1 TetR/AcrR family transcriptional regulator [Jatrophihabitans endophyticus]